MYVPVAGVLKLKPEAGACVAVAGAPRGAAVPAPPKLNPPPPPPNPVAAADELIGNIVYFHI